MNLPNDCGETFTLIKQSNEGRERERMEVGIIPLQEIIFKEATSSQQSKNFRRIHFRATVSIYRYHSNIY